MQMEMGQLDIHDVPGFRIELLTPRLVQSPFGFFHQLVVALVVPASQSLRIVALGIEIAAKKAIRVKTVAVALNTGREIALLLGLDQRNGIEGLDGHLETCAGPHLLDDLRALTIIGQVGVTDQLDGRPHCLGLFEQRFRFLRVIFEATTPLQVPGIAARVDLVEHVTLSVEHRIMDSIAVDGVRGSGAYDLVLEWALAKIKDHEDPPEMESPGVVLITVALLETLYVRVGHIIDQMHLAGA